MFWEGLFSKGLASSVALFRPWNYLEIFFVRGERKSGTWVLVSLLGGLKRQVNISHHETLQSAAFRHAEPSGGVQVICGRGFCISQVAILVTRVATDLLAEAVPAVRLPAGRGSKDALGGEGRHGHHSEQFGRALPCPMPVSKSRQCPKRQSLLLAMNSVCLQGCAEAIVSNVWRFVLGTCGNLFRLAASPRDPRRPSVLPGPSAATTLRTS